MPSSQGSEKIDKATQLGSTLCEKCQQYSEETFFFVKLQALKHLKCQRWGILESWESCDIKKNIHCPLCRLVCSSLAEQGLSCDDDSIYYYRLLFGTYQVKNSLTQSITLDDMVEGQEDNMWNLYLTNRLHVSTSPCVLDNVGYELARIRDTFGPTLEPPKVEADILLLAKNRTKPQDGFLQGRPVGGQVDFDLCRSWINICIEDHGGNCTPVPLHEFPGRRLTVIDVERRMIVLGVSACSYAALSYTWGKGVKQLELSQITLKRLTTPGGLDDEWSDIPQTIRDAMILCSRLSVRFLWVDALCIQQDDEENKHNQMHIMDAIYSGATFTIVAAFGRDSWAGLPGVQSNTCFVENAEVVGSLTLATAQSTLYSATKDLPWNTRAWIFQEAILSKRLLIFTEGVTYFQCNTALWWEDTQQEVPPPNATMIQTPHTLTPFFKRALPSEPDFTSYAELVEDYTRQSMTKHTDSLNAFSGIIHALEKPFNAEFFQGLPLIFFDIALCFETPFLEDIERRSEFPSWSWCGWKVEDGVSYDDFREKKQVKRNIFYRVIPPDLDNEKKIVPICAVSIFIRSLLELPTISKTILDSMSNAEHEKLLIFETWTARVFISAEGNGKDAYVITPSLSTASKSLGTIDLWPLWRKYPRYEQLFYFIEICRWSRADGNESLFVLLVEKDDRGISERIQLYNIDVKEWMGVERVFETVYLL
ncbi:heterokaryon incompatibility protein-domain-containing protein [Xylogone sp. PMI_703]|nr:heterokaryon incompatibility protein-domain-containing protein [Xylogone sp. PMI_703]